MKGRPQMKNLQTKRIVLTALLAAVITICTRFTSIPIFSGMGYVHVGDAFIFLAASLLPTPYAMAAGAIGGALADLSSGFVAYILPTAIIKALMALMFRLRAGEKKLLTKRSVISLVLSIVVLVLGYYAAEAIMYQNLISPLIGMVWNLMQGIFSGAGFLLFAAALDAAKLRDRLEI